MMDINKQILFFSYEWDGLPFRRKILINLLPVSIFIEKWCLPENVDTDLLFLQSMCRKDYNDFCMSIYQAIEPVDCKYIKIQKNVKLNIDFMYALKHTKEIWNQLEEYGFAKKVFILLKILQVISLERVFEKYKVSRLLVHAEMQPVENYAVQYFKDKKKTTSTLQHGLYIDYHLSRNINEVNYKYISTDTFLAWGEDTETLIKSYNPDVKVVLCGNPGGGVLSPNERNKKNVITVVFDQELFKKNNQKLLDIAIDASKSLSMKVYIKLHPKNQIEDYFFDKTRVTVNFNVCDSAFALGHTSTYMVELMSIGIPVFKLLSPVPCLTFDNDITFSDVTELCSKLKNITDLDFEKMANSYIISSGIKAQNMYSTTIK